MRDSTSCLVAVTIGMVVLLASEGCGRTGYAHSTDTAIAGDVPLGSGGAMGTDGALAEQTGSGDTLGSGGSTGTGGFYGTGGTTGTGGGLGQDSAIDADVVVDGGSASTEGPSCGDTVCTAAQLCVRPTCGGGTPPCLPPLDGGACPAGRIYASLCVPGLPERGAGCTFPPCEAPPPFCIDLPAACGAKPTCACLPYNVCNSDGGVSSGMCGLINTSVVTCMAQ